MYDENDAAADQAYEQLSDEIIDQFKSDLFHAALTNASRSVDLVRTVLQEAEKVRPASPSAAYVFAASATEIAFKKLLLEPLVSGVIHNEVATPFIASAILKQKSYRALVVRLVSVATKIKLEEYKRKGAAKDILSEANDVAERRNGIIHRAELASEQEADYALLVANELLNGVFAAVLRVFRLRMLKEGEQSARWQGDSTIVQSFGQ